jgi:hypothetical protein
MSTNPFDPANLRLDQKYVQNTGVQKMLTTVPVRKPNRQDFVRVNPSEEYRLQAALIELREDRETYLVTPDIVLYIEGEFVPAVLYTAINRQGVLSLWPVKLPNSDGRINEWHRTAMVAAEEAMSRWVRVSANMSLGAYEITAATRRNELNRVADLKDARRYFGRTTARPGVAGNAVVGNSRGSLPREARGQHRPRPPAKAAGRGVTQTRRRPTGRRHLFIPGDQC